MLMRWDVLVMKVMKVKGQVTVNLLLQALVQVKAFVLVVVVVKVFVVQVEEVLLFSISSPPPLRPAARAWAWGAKGLGCLIVLPAPGRRCSGPFP